MSVRPFYLDGTPPLLALFHPAAGATAVLLCPPIGWDDVASYRSRRDWAVHLADTGHPTLRFDLPGTGDSGGRPDDAGLLDAWVEAVVAAARWLDAETGARRVAAIGIGAGGLLAWLAAARDAPIDDLVLWGVPARGKTLVRELRTFARMEASSIVAAGAPEGPPLPEGVLAPGGFMLSAETVAALAAVDLTQSTLPPGKRTLLLDRDGLAVDADLVAHLDTLGVEATTGAGDGFGGMLAQPDKARAPRRVFETVGAWLAEGAPSGRAADPAPPSSGSVVTGGVCETPFVLEQPFGRLVGVLSEPVGGESLPLTAVFLNAGAMRRSGPNRMWVDIGRRWAARGVATLRIDLEGIGDADGESERFSDVGQLYVPRFVDQVRATLDELQARGAPPRFLVAGLCSGAFWAFHTAIADDRVATALMFNPRVVFWDEELEPVRDVRRIRQQLLRASSWRRVLTREIPMNGDRLRALVLATLRAPFRSGSDNDRVDVAFDALQRTGARAVFAFCEGGEPLREELEAAGKLAQPERWPRVEVELIPGRDHTLRPLWMHPYVHAVADAALQRTLDSERAPADRPAIPAPVGDGRPQRHA
jgi:dienelactone hydrolase